MMNDFNILLVKFIVYESLIIIVYLELTIKYDNYGL